MMMLKRALHSPAPKAPAKSGPQNGARSSLRAKLRMTLTGLAILIGFTATAPSTALACCPSGCVPALHSQTRAVISNQHNLTRIFMTQEMKKHQRWWFNDFFNQYILPAEMMMAEQLVTVGMQQMKMVGAMLDAKHQLESQLLFQRLTARTHKDYHSSHGMCTIATAMRSLAASDRRAEGTAHILMRRSQARQLGNMDSLGSDGAASDKASRVMQFIERYCDIHETNATLEKLCKKSAPSETVGKDINYTRLIETPLTIDVDYFEGEEPEGDEADVFAMAALVFSHNVFYRFPEAEGAILQNQPTYLDMRSVIAKRSVAENSFYNVIGMKARGSEESEDTAGYIGAILHQLGVPKDEVFIMLGERPSYFALMNVLSQKIYQRPEFYTDLYEKPANVQRKDVAMQAVDLMLDRDIYKSDLRSEMMLAVLLELELMKHQGITQSNITKASRDGRPETTGGTP